jgi:hypothetical protein
VWLIYEESDPAARKEIAESNKQSGKRDLKKKYGVEKLPFDKNHSTSLLATRSTELLVRT